MKTYTFKSIFGEIKTIKADIDGVKETVQNWEVKNPPPQIPVIEMTEGKLSWEQVRRADKRAVELGISSQESRKQMVEEIGDRENPNDPDYIRKLAEWEARKWLFSEEILVWNYVLLPMSIDRDDLIDGCMLVKDVAKEKLWEYADFTVFNKIRTDLGDSGTRLSEKVKLYNHINQTSQLTYQAVLEAARKFWYQMEGETHLRSGTQGKGRATRYYRFGLYSRFREWRTSTRLLEKRGGRASTNIGSLVVQELVKLA